MAIVRHDLSFAQGAAQAQSQTTGLPIPICMGPRSRLRNCFDFTARAAYLYANRNEPRRHEGRTAKTHRGLGLSCLGTHLTLFRSGCSPRLRGSFSYEVLLYNKYPAGSAKRKGILEKSPRSIHFPIAAEERYHGSAGEALRFESLSATRRRVGRDGQGV